MGVTAMATVLGGCVTHLSGFSIGRDEAKQPLSVVSENTRHLPSGHSGQLGAIQPRSIVGDDIEPLSLDDEPHEPIQSPIVVREDIKHLSSAGSEHDEAMQPLAVMYEDVKPLAAGIGQNEGISARDIVGEDTKTSSDSLIEGDEVTRLFIV
jgi:hypothetical protein